MLHNVTQRKKFKNVILNNKLIEPAIKNLILILHDC